jgi:mycofactocin system glycosyltransferase
MRLAADSTLRREDSGRMVMGGSPLRILRLTDRGVDRLDRWLDGGPVGERTVDRRLVRRLLDAGLVHPVGSADSVERTLTIVVPVRDDAHGLEQLLDGLGGSHPVVVVDDASKDGRVHERAARLAGASYLRRERALGPGPARMLGLELVDSELVAFVDADVTMGEATLGDLSGHFDDPEVVAVAPRVRTRPDRPGPLAAYEAGHSPLDLGPEPSPVGPGRRVTYVPAACLVVRTEVLRAIGGFDPNLRWGEDVDLVWRLVAEGHTVRYDPAVEVAHRPRPNLRAWIDQRRSYGSSAAPLSARHGLAVAPTRCSPWSAAAWGVALAGHPLIGFGVAAGSTARLASRLNHLPDGIRLAARLGMAGHANAALALTRTAGRAWWPITLGVAAAHRPLRAKLLLTLLVPPLIGWIRGPRSAGLVTTIGLGVADDMAYGLGVWEGMWKERSWAAIRPELGSRPDRDDISTDG